LIGRKDTLKVEDDQRPAQNIDGRGNIGGPDAGARKTTATIVKACVVSKKLCRRSLAGNTQAIFSLPSSGTGAQALIFCGSLRTLRGVHRCKASK
jgi:hypothetical protein